jgi:hypothetical protein
MSQFSTMLWLLSFQGILGAFDTIYFHEWRARLPALQRAAKRELLLHSARDHIYAVLLLTLPWLKWQGWWMSILTVLLLLEIVLTMWDFVVEDSVRKPLGGVYSAERVVHGVLGVLYGLFLAALIPLMVRWYGEPTRLARQQTFAPGWLKWTLSVMGILACLSGLRDSFGAYSLPYSAWPWSAETGGQRR